MPIFYFLFLAMGIGGSINQITFHGFDVSCIQFTSIGILGTLKYINYFANVTNRVSYSNR